MALAPWAARLQGGRHGGRGRQPLPAGQVAAPLLFTEVGQVFQLGGEGGWEHDFREDVLDVVARGGWRVVGGRGGQSGGRQLRNPTLWLATFLRGLHLLQLSLCLHSLELHGSLLTLPAPALPLLPRADIARLQLLHRVVDEHRPPQDLFGVLDAPQLPLAKLQQPFEYSLHMMKQQ